MISIVGTARIEVVKGDTLTFWLTCKKGLDSIKSVSFVSTDLSIDQDMPAAVVTDQFGNQEHGFSLRIADTAGLEVGDHTYSIVINFKNSDVKTIVYQKDLVVLPLQKEAN